MKVILLQNVAQLGQKGDAKEVKSGYWRNFLMPRSLAVLATPERIKQAETEKAREAEQKKLRERKLSEDLSKIKDKTLIVELKADEKGNLFAGVDTKKISEFIKERMNFDIPEDFIKLEKPIKQIGFHEIPVKDFILKLEIKSQDINN